MTETLSPWADAQKWKENWEVVAEIPGGGQGAAYSVRRGGDHAPGFLKVIKSKKDHERRARFSREANAYDTMRVLGVPRLIESNAHHHADLQFEPYIVTEWIEGPTLTKWRLGQTSVSLAVAVDMTIRLTSILDGCHGEGVVHRDIKPDNIILKGSEPGQPWLLDFGLNHHDMPEIDFRTEDWQEVGNRFLRLPELSAGSLLKQDPRSDVSFVAGILFFLLTGQHPGLLEDQDGKLPHRRPAVLASIQAAAGDRLMRLAALFDRAFAPRIEGRFPTATALRTRLEELMEGTPDNSSYEDDLRHLREVLDTPDQERLAKVSQGMNQGFTAAMRLVRALLPKVGHGLSVEPTSNNFLGERGHYHLMVLNAARESLATITFEMDATGDEFALSVGGAPAYRTSIEAPDWGEPLGIAANRPLVSQLKKALLNPTGLPPEAVYFKEMEPKSTIELAQAEASKAGRPILAFVYDPTQHERGQLDHGLRYFLQNKKTRDAMNGAFVTALVPLPNFSAANPCLEGLSMERSRWVVLDPDLKSKEEAVIYANGEEGEKIMERLVARYAPH